MSEALERVIAEQQAEIDRMKAQLISSVTTRQKELRNIEAIFTYATQAADWYKLRGCWKDDKEKEWKEYADLRYTLLNKLREYGFCTDCHSLTCFGECHDG